MTLATASGGTHMQQGNIMDGIGKARKPFDLFKVVTAYLPAILLFGSLLFLCLLPGVFLLSKPYYMAHGSILVERVQESFFVGDEQAPIANFYYDYAQTEVQRLMHDTTIATALENLPPVLQEKYAPAGVTPKAVDALRKNLTVGLIPNTHIITVQLRSASPAGTADVVNTLMATYLKHAAQVAESKEERRLTYLLEEREVLKTEMDRLSAQLSLLAEQAKTSSFAEAYNVDSLRLIELQKAWVAARLSRLELENSFSETLAKVDRLRELPTSALSDELVANDESLWSVTYWTYKTTQEMRATIDGVKPSNPDRRYIVERMEAMKQYEAKLRKDREEHARHIVTGKRDHTLKSEAITAEAAYLAAQKTELALQQEMHAAQDSAAENAKRIIRGQDISAELQHARERLHALDSRIQHLRAESKSPFRVSIEEQAQPSDIPAGDHTKKLLFLCFAGAFGSVGCLFLVIELGDNRIRSARDIAHATGHPPSWPISVWKGNLPFHLVTETAPESRPARALRSLAVRLNSERQRQGAKVAVLAPVDGLSGTTSIGLNTARALAAFGVGLLVIEAGRSVTSLQQMCRGALKPAPVTDDAQGALPANVHVMRSTEEPFDILTVNEDRLPWGTLAARRDTNSFGKALGLLRDRYDFILVDAPPVRQSDLTEYLLLQSDIAVIITQGDRTTYAHLRQALEIIIRLQVPAVITVLNWGSARTRNLAERHLARLPAWLLRRIMPSLLTGSFTDAGTGAPQEAPGGHRAPLKTRRKARPPGSSGQE